MVPNVEESYERIANAIIAELPDGWVEARLTAIFYPDSITWEPEFVMADSTPRSFDVSLELTRAFRELRRRFKEAGQPLWGQASFELRSDGKFNMTWGYGNCDAQGDTIWDEEEWNRRHEERRRRLARP